MAAVFATLLALATLGVRAQDASPDDRFDVLAVGRAGPNAQVVAEYRLAPEGGWWSEPDAWAKVRGMARGPFKLQRTEQPDPTANTFKFYVNPQGDHLRLRFDGAKVGEIDFQVHGYPALRRAGRLRYVQPDGEPARRDAEDTGLELQAPWER